MTNVMVELSMSLDGYVTGPDVSPEEPMGRGGGVAVEDRAGLCAGSAEHRGRGGAGP
jgi:hypothetical protein